MFQGVPPLIFHGENDCSGGGAIKKNEILTILFYN